MARLMLVIIAVALFAITWYLPFFTAMTILGVFAGATIIVILVGKATDRKPKDVEKADGEMDAKSERLALLSGDYRKCPFCAELIKSEATKCRYCGSDLT